MFAYCFKLFFLTATPLFLISNTAAALDIPPTPTIIPIVDQANVMSEQQEQELAAKIAAERQVSSNQIAVLTVKSLEGESLEEYSLNVAREWGIGTKERNNGVLLLVAIDDRKLRIEVGYGLEGALPDIRANQIIQSRITPEFRQGRYYEGINSGVDGIIAAVHNEYDSALKEPVQAKKNIPWDLYLTALIVLPSWLAAMLARTKSWWAGGIVGAVLGVIAGLIFGFIFIGIMSIIILAILGLILDKLVSGNYQKRVSQGLEPSWWAGGTKIGGNSGFGGFGGGGFGGGGSSGSW